MDDLYLEPCPFCKGEAELRSIGNNPKYANHFAECKKCFAIGPAGDSPAEAAEKWNRRFGRARLSEVL